MELIRRHKLIEEIELSLRSNAVTALLGPRQCGKTSLARQFHVPPENYFDLEAPLDRIRLQLDPMAVLSSLQGTIVIDEVQLMPELFPLLRVLSDNPVRLYQFLILGSASPDLIQNSSESLAGRIHFIDMSGFLLPEIAGLHAELSHWLRGGYPKSLLSATNQTSLEWRLDYIRTFLVTDLPQYIQTKLSEQDRYRLLSTIAHYHAQTWNSSKIGSVVSLNYKTIQHYMDLFEGAYLVRCVPAYSKNMGKRLRSAPKYYFRDAGLLHALLQIQTIEQLQTHPIIGASWEGYALEHILQSLKPPKGSYFYWGIHNGPELDLLLEQPTGLYGFEFKASTAPSVTDSMRKAIAHLGLKKLWIIYPGKDRLILTPSIELLPVRHISAGLI